MINKLITILILCLFICHGSAISASNESVFTLEEILVKSRKIPSNFELSPFKNVIYQEKYKGLFKSTSEIISHGLSTEIKSTGGIGQTETVSIRGVNSGQIAVFLDDIRLNGLNGGGFDFSLIPLNFLEKVEVFRGGFSGEFGLDALGGAIRLKTKNEKGKSNYGVSYTNGSFGTNRFNLSALCNLKDINFIIEAQNLATDGKFVFLDDQSTETKLDDKVQIRENNYSKLQNILFKLSSKESDKKEVTYLMQYSKIHRGIAGIVTFPSDTSYENKSLVLNQINIKNYLKDMEIDIGLGYKYATLYFLDRDGDLTGAPIETDQKEQGFNADVSLRKEINTKNYFSAKYEYNYLNIKDLIYGTPNRKISSISIKNESNLCNDKLFFTGRLRFDIFKDTNNISNTRKYFQVNPHISAFYEINKKFNIKTNFGRSYRLPNFSELYLDQGLIVGNPDLKNEKAWHYDLGFGYKGDSIKSELSYFYENLTDTIQFVLISGFRFKPLNVEKARISGIEWATDFKINKYASFIFGYTYLNAIDKTGKPNQDGMQLVGRPKNKIDININCNIHKAKMLLDFSYLSGNYLTQSNTKILPKRFDVNMDIIYQVKKNISISMDIKNILDRHDYDLRGFPLPGRSLYSTLNINW